MGLSDLFGDPFGLLFLGLSSGLLLSRDGESPLHVVWLFWEAMSKRVETVHLNAGGGVVSLYIGLVIG
ncbi:hypothetical protein RchiOBHm_Chr2g0158851 [Rosa chinensis]|uniref:Uncharacterized protein n=1 Tax=Rosa chinensis TaxID=74649 RepID=A0A2P6S250_ROSCH|nr:hypothetical protein RchiOBHm_Chr2g0158851 [Rosa chinensis]